MAVRINFPVFNGQQPFGILGSHAEQGSNPHPKQRTGTARHQCGGYAHNISGADGGGHGGAERTEAADFAGAARLVLYHIFQRQGKMPDLQSPHPNGKIDSGSKNQNNQRNSPHEIVDVR